jgi:hypothetical protein
MWQRGVKLQGKRILSWSIGVTECFPAKTKSSLISTEVVTYVKNRPACCRQGFHHPGSRSDGVLEDVIHLQTTSLSAKTIQVDYI